MKRITPYIIYILSAAFLAGLVYVGIREHQSALRRAENASAVMETLKIENAHLQKLSDSLFDRTVILDQEQDRYERLADSLGEIANRPELPCEHELALKKEEVKYVRAALDKCKETKAIQTQRVGLAEIRVENQVELCGKMMAVHKQDLKEEKRKSFLRGMGVGGLAVGILIILAL